MRINEGPFGLYNIDIHPPASGRGYARPLRVFAEVKNAVWVFDGDNELVADGLCEDAEANLKAQEWLLNLALLTVSFKE